MMWHQLHCVNAVMTAAGIVQEIRCGSERRFMFPYLVRDKYLRQDFPSTKRDESANPTTTQTTPTPPTPPRSPTKAVPTAATPPEAVDKRMMALKMILESVVKQISTTSGSSLTGEPWFPLNEHSLASSQAAIMEIAGSEICKVGVVDILGQGTLSAGVTQGSAGANPVIALAVPQWMLLQRCQSPPSPFITASPRAADGVHQHRPVSHGVTHQVSLVSPQSSVVVTADMKVPVKPEQVETQPWSSAVSSKLKEL